MSAVQERKLGGEQQLERRQRQLTELEALEAMFGADGGFCVSDLDARDLVRGVVDSCNAAPDTFSDSLPLIGCRVEIAAAASVDKATDHAVSITFPRDYPDGAATCRVEWTNGTRAELEGMNGGLQEFADSLAGEESGLQVIQFATQIVEEAWDEKREAAAARTTAPQTSLVDRVLGRRMIYFHHIINEGKREMVSSWAIQLRLGGYSKIGWPGLVVVEGSEEACKEYVRCLQRLKWQQMLVRGEEREELLEGESVDSRRRLHMGFEELGTDGMSTLAQRSACKSAGLDDLFKTFMKSNTRVPRSPQTVVANLEVSYLVPTI